ncbi:MAG TPA: tetratricopeptide repeat protein [Chloroflexota bacterium]|nr:tetratricopeptide repeat protein [Chloroflexota bacterium]
MSFLFTDIEGSTRLLEQHPQEMGAAMSRHHDLLREAVEANGGIVFETLGDGVYASFARARDGIRAAIGGQRAIRAEDWSAVGELRVRMGLHTGDVQVRGEHYFGPALFRCARLMAIGHGGQILLSRATRDLVDEGLPPGASLRALGTHRLKDLAEPTEIYQLVHPDLPADFPPLNSLDILANNLPTQTTRFIGRQREVAAVRELASAQRLLTLSGTGGAGKTRLALQVAADLVDTFKDGVWLVELGPIADPALVPQAVASALSVREEPGRAPLSALVEFVRSRNLLVLLDSCEHVVQACAELANTLLRAAPDLHILVTSREVLGISGETTWRVPSLSLPPKPPPPPESMDQYEAVGLFVERARAANTNFRLTAQNAAAVMEICARLDGIPLAIELAAARIRMLSVEQIAARLDDRFRLLTGGSRAAMPRQRTLRALVDWSYGLLQETERMLFRRLSIFAGGWTLEAAETVCGGDGLEPYDVLDLLMQLVDKSLVIADEQAGHERYRTLETIREYARERLTEAGELPAVQERHYAWFVGLAEQAPPEGYDTRGLATVGHEYDNLRAALRWAVDSGESERALRLAGGLWSFWSVRGFYTEGRAWLREVLALGGGESRPGIAARARALQAAGHLANCQGDYAAAADLLEESRTISEELGDQTALGAALHLLGNLAIGQGELEQAGELFMQARELNRRSGNRAAEILNMLQLAEVAFQTGDTPQSLALGEDVLRTSRERGQQWGVARSLHVIGRVAARDGDFSRAARLHEQSLGIQQELGDLQGQVRSLAALARVAVGQGDAQLARERYLDSLRVARQSYELLEIARSLEGLAELYAEVDPERALRLAGAAGVMRKTIGAEPYAEELRRLNAWQQPVYVALGEKRCAEARAAGRGMSLDQAINEVVAGAAVSS